MSDFVMGYGDIGYDAFYSGGTWSGTLDEQMLNRQLITAVARTSDATELVLDITLTVSQVIGVVGIINHNMSNIGTYQWLAYSDSNRLTNIYDSGVITAGTYYEHLTNKTTCDSTGDVSTSYWRLKINDASNPDGFHQIGRLFFGKRFYPGRNMDYGLKIGVIDDSTDIISSPIGIEIFVDSPNKRTANFTFNQVDYANGDGFIELGLRDGISGACLFEFDPANKSEGTRTFICRQKALSPLDYLSYDINSFSVSLVEII